MTTRQAARRPHQILGRWRRSSDLPKSTNEHPAPHCFVPGLPDLVRVGRSDRKPHSPESGPPLDVVKPRSPSERWATSSERPPRSQAPRLVNGAPLEAACTRADSRATESAGGKSGRRDRVAHELPLPELHVTSSQPATGRRTPVQFSWNDKVCALYDVRTPSVKSRASRAPSSATTVRFRCQRRTEGLFRRAPINF
jgi:hypothetical protein